LPFDAARLAVPMIHSTSALATGSGLNTRIDRRLVIASETFIDG
jgi:hypothetical protein